MVALVAAAVVAQQIVSPQVHSDRTVTFRFRSPNAQKVEVSLEGSPSLSMTKDAAGVWTATSKPMAPDIYGYSFSVDGVGILDPSNPAIKPNLIWVGNMVTVPGNQPWEVANVPHGELHRHFYRSGIIGDERDYYVYTPPSYRASKSKLPVLYLLHGYSDTANGWTAVGQAHVILDNLLAAGKIKPMVVVMPLGYGVPGFASPGSPAFGNRDLTKTSFERFHQSLMKEVRPQVEKNYRVSKDRAGRAIAGLSMGGAESLYIGLSNLDDFSAIGAFSSGGLPANQPTEIWPKLDAPKVNRLKAFWMACGTEDGLIGFQRGFAGWVKSQGGKVTTKETPGGHTWMLWRRNLAEFAGMIFRD